MSRIIYACLPSKGIAGGAKMIFRHVEALQDLGYEAVVRVRSRDNIPPWFDTEAAVDTGDPLRDDDIIVAPEDGANLLRSLAPLPHRKIIFCQNHYYSVRGMGQLSPSELSAYLGVMACSRTVAAWCTWRHPSLSATVVPAFADERRFRPAAKTPSVVFIPRKRAAEAAYIEDAFLFAHPRHAGLEWLQIENLHENRVAQTLGESTIFLSLSWMEGLGMAPLEAMAAGCIPAGYTGGGGREYATADNGFWVNDEDPAAVVIALAEAADLLATGGPALERMLEAGRETAARWSHAAFLKALDAFWAPIVGRTAPTLA